MKKILSLFSFGVLLLGSVSLSAMDGDDFRVALQAQFQEAYETRNIDTLFELKGQLISQRMMTEQDFADLIQSLTDGQAAPAGGVDSDARMRQQRIEENRALREEQDRAYQEALRIDQERAAQEQARLREEQEQLYAEQEAQETQEEAWRQEQFNFSAILDRCIAELAGVDNPREHFNAISSNLGNHIGLVQQFRRQGLNVARALQEANQTHYASEHGCQQEMCRAISTLLEEPDEILAQRRAQRIVQNFFLNPDPAPAEPVETAEAAHSAGDAEETKEQPLSGGDLTQSQQPVDDGAREDTPLATTVEPVKDKDQKGADPTDSGCRRPASPVEPREGSSWGEWLRSPTGIATSATVAAGTAVVYWVVRSLRGRR